MKVVLDTNVYISAVLFGGKPQTIINLARNKRIGIIISEYILWEIRDVLQHKFCVPDVRLNIIEHDILSLCKLIPVVSKIRVVSEHPADNAILACAVDGSADMVVTGDKHLLKLNRYEGIKIVTPHFFLMTLGK